MRQWLLVVLALAAFALVFNTHLLSYGSLWCDQRVNQISAEKDKSVRQAIDQMHEALAQQDASVEALQAERAVSRALRKKLAKLAKGDERLQRLLKLADERQDEQLSSHTSRRRASPPLEEAAAAPPSPPAASAAVASSLTAAAAASTASTASAAAAPLVASRLVPSAIAVVVIAYNRPQYLDRALGSIFKHHPGGGQFPVYVSQDGEQPGVASVIQKHGARRLVHPRQPVRLKPGTYLAKFPGYAYLAIHYGWALNTLFGMPGNGASGGEGGGGGGGGGGGPFAGVIILEEDIEVAPDFWSYFTHTAPLLEADPSLLCVSAFNDNGQSSFRGEPTALHRSDFFPVSQPRCSSLRPLCAALLAAYCPWLLAHPDAPPAPTLSSALLRSPPLSSALLGRGSAGCSRASSGRSLGPSGQTRLASGTIGCARRHRGVGVPLSVPRSLAPSPLDPRAPRSASSTASTSPTSSSTPSPSTSVRSICATCSRTSTMPSSSAGSATRGWCIASIRRGARRRPAGPAGGRWRHQGALPRQGRVHPLLQGLGLMEDLKAGIPRTAYHGVVLVRINGRRVFLAPSYRVDQEIIALPPPGK